MSMSLPFLKLEDIDVCSKCLDCFSRSHEFRTNDISKSYNHVINTHIDKANPNIYKKFHFSDEESKTSVSFERANQGTQKYRNSKSIIKDKEIEILKLKYTYGELESMDFLMKKIDFVRNFDDSFKNKKT